MWAGRWGDNLTWPEPPSALFILKWHALFCLSLLAALPSFRTSHIVSFSDTFWTGGDFYVFILIIYLFIFFQHVCLACSIWCQSVSSSPLVTEGWGRAGRRGRCKINASFYLSARTKTSQSFWMIPRTNSLLLYVLYFAPGDIIMLWHHCMPEHALSYSLVYEVVSKSTWRK